MREAFRRWWESTPPSHLEGVLILSYDLPAASFHLEASPSSSLRAVADTPCSFIFFFNFSLNGFRVLNLYLQNTTRRRPANVFVIALIKKDTPRRSYMDKPLLTVSSSKVLHGVFLKQCLVSQVIYLSICTYFHRSLLISISFGIPPLNG